MNELAGHRREKRVLKKKLPQLEGREEKKELVKKIKKLIAYHEEKIWKLKGRQAGTKS